jgi:DNA-binding MarR family transcriptional regulator
MSDDPKWDNVAKQITAVSDRMMRAGWVTKTFHTSEGFGIDYTPEGMEKMKQLLELLRSLDLATMTTEDLDALQAIVRQFGSNTGRPL